MRNPAKVFTPTVDDDSAVQRAYYAASAASYEQMHINPRDEHYFALHFLVGMFDYLEIRSVLDIGSGTGRAIRHIKQARPDIRVVGVEPVPELREIGYSMDLSRDELIDGDALNLAFNASEFGLCCEFGVLRHIKTPARVVEKMLRVTPRAAFLSDSNNLGYGSAVSRFIKQLLHALGLWLVADYIKTRGQGYGVPSGKISTTGPGKWQRRKSELNRIQTIASRPSQKV